MELSERLQMKRKELGFTQEEIAEKINVSRQTISNWETGRTLPDINSLIMISDVYGISLDELIKGDNQMIKKLSKDSKEAERWFTFSTIISSSLSIFINFLGSRLDSKLLVVFLIFQALIIGYIWVNGWPFLKNYQALLKDQKKSENQLQSYDFTKYDFMFMASIISGLLTMFTMIVFYI